MQNQTKTLTTQRKAKRGSVIEVGNKLCKVVRCIEDYDFDCYTLTYRLLSDAEVAEIESAEKAERNKESADQAAEEALNNKIGWLKANFNLEAENQVGFYQASLEKEYELVAKFSRTTFVSHIFKVNENKYIAWKMGGGCFDVWSR